MQAIPPLLPTGKVIAHVDLDAFYSQVETFRDLPRLKDKPVGVVQYNPRGDLTTLPPEADRLMNNSNGSLIAVNYLARAKGVKRNMSGNEARALCPEIQLVQVPVKHQKSDLTIYRNAGKRVLQILSRKSICERASIDECYLDVTLEAHKRLEKSAGLPPYPVEPHQIHVYESNGEDIPADRWWNRPQHTWGTGELLLASGAAVVAELRQAVERELGYTCSAGIAHTRLLAKLCSGLHKPAQQTILPAVSVGSLLGPLPLGKLRGLGGQFGTKISEDLHIDTVGQLSSTSLTKLESLYGTKDAKWLFDLARGIDDQDVEERKLPKSVSCGKTFRGDAALADIESVHGWLLELAGELEERLLEDKEDNARVPQLLTVSIGFQSNTGAHATHSSSAVQQLTSAVNYQHQQWLKSMHVSRSCSFRKMTADAIAADATALVKKWSQQKQGQWWKIVDLFLNASNFVQVQSTSITQFFNVASSNGLHGTDNSSGDGLYGTDNSNGNVDKEKKLYGGDVGCDMTGADTSKHAVHAVEVAPERIHSSMEISTTIDEAVLAELPIDIQKEIRSQMKMEEMSQILDRGGGGGSGGIGVGTNVQQQKRKGATGGTSGASSMTLKEFLKGKRQKK